LKCYECGGKSDHSADCNSEDKPPPSLIECGFHEDICVTFKLNKSVSSSSSEGQVELVELSKGCSSSQNEASGRIDGKDVEIGKCYEDKVIAKKGNAQLHDVPDELKVKLFCTCKTDGCNEKNDGVKVKESSSSSSSISSFTIGLLRVLILSRVLLGSLVNY
jgi:hypothetical protein